jgi:hypothetical protein
MYEKMYYVCIIYMYILIYAHMQAYECVHVYMYVRIYARLTHSGMYDVRMCVCMCVCVCVCIYIYLYIYIYITSLYVSMCSTFMLFTCMHVCCVRVCVCVCMCVCVCFDMTSVNQAVIRTYTFPDFPDEISCLSVSLFNKDVCPQDTGLALAQAVIQTSLIAEPRIQTPREWKWIHREECSLHLSLVSRR